MTTPNKTELRLAPDNYNVIVGRIKDLFKTWGFEENTQMVSRVILQKAMCEAGMSKLQQKIYARADMIATNAGKQEALCDLHRILDPILPRVFGLQRLAIQWLPDNHPDRIKKAISGMVKDGYLIRRSQGTNRLGASATHWLAYPGLIEDLQMGLSGHPVAGKRFQGLVDRYLHFSKNLPISRRVSETDPASGLKIDTLLGG